MNTKRSKLLFIGEDGESMVFHMSPGGEKNELKNLIEYGGGTMVATTSAPSVNFIRLVAMGTTAGESSVKSQYIRDCVNKNKLLDIELYRLKPGDIYVECGANGNDDDMEPAQCIVRQHKAAVKGRTKFTREDDLAIINYMAEGIRMMEARGVNVWKALESLKLVKGHTAQSCKDRFFKKILPHLDDYDLPPRVYQSLTGRLPEERNAGRKESANAVPLVAEKSSSSVASDVSSYFSGAASTSAACSNAGSSGVKPIVIAPTVKSSSSLQLGLNNNVVEVSDDEEEGSVNAQSEEDATQDVTLNDSRSDLDDFDRNLVRGATASDGTVKPICIAPVVRRLPATLSANQKTSSVSSAPVTVTSSGISDVLSNQSALSSVTMQANLNAPAVCVSSALTTASTQAASSSSAASQAIQSTTDTSAVSTLPSNKTVTSITSSVAVISATTASSSRSPKKLVSQTSETAAVVSTMNQVNAVVSTGASKSSNQATLIVSTAASLSVHVSVAVTTSPSLAALTVSTAVTKSSDQEVPLSINSLSNQTASVTVSPNRAVSAAVTKPSKQISSLAASPPKTTDQTASTTATTVTSSLSQLPIMSAAVANKNTPPRAALVAAVPESVTNVSDREDVIDDGGNDEGGVSGANLEMSLKTRVKRKMPGLPIVLGTLKRKRPAGVMYDNRSDEDDNVRGPTPPSPAVRLTAAEVAAAVMAVNNDDDRDSIASDSTPVEDAADDSETSRSPRHSEHVRLHRSSSSGRRVLYTYNEDKAIINYMSAHNRFSQISGNVVWKQLEMSKLLPGRTWQSMKDRFRCYILPGLQDYHLPEATVRLFTGKTAGQGARDDDSDEADEEEEERPSASLAKGIPLPVLPDSSTSSLNVKRPKHGSIVSSSSASTTIPRRKLPSPIKKRPSSNSKKNVSFGSVEFSDSLDDFDLDLVEQAELKGDSGADDGKNPAKRRQSAKSDANELECKRTTLGRLSNKQENESKVTTRKRVVVCDNSTSSENSEEGPPTRGGHKLRSATADSPSKAANTLQSDGDKKSIAGKDKKVASPSPKKLRSIESKNRATGHNLRSKRNTAQVSSESSDDGASKNDEDEEDDGGNEREDAKRSDEETKPATRASTKLASGTNANKTSPKHASLKTRSEPAIVNNSPRSRPKNATKSQHQRSTSGPTTESDSVVSDTITSLQFFQEWLDLSADEAMALLRQCDGSIHKVRDYVRRLLAGDEEESEQL